jgi:ribose transport system permease protein
LSRQPPEEKKNVRSHRFNPLNSIEGSKILGISCLLLAIGIYTTLSTDRFLLAGNLENIVHRTALFGILSIGAAFVIITGGIDLSIGSVVCLTGVLLPYLLTQCQWSMAAALAAVGGLSIAVGAFHGIMITKLRLQPFVVTLCGLLLYRGVARGITSDQSQGFGTAFKGLRTLATGHMRLFSGDDFNFRLPATALILIVVALAAMVILNKTVFGRYLLAIGSNPEAAKYSGINVDRATVAAYILCSTLAGLGGVLFVLDINAAQPSDFGNFYELYAIAAAVLGGCSLRGGEGNIAGVVVGAAVMVVLSNAINLVHPQYQNIEFAIIGGVILAGVTADALIRRILKGY